MAKGSAGRAGAKAAEALRGAGARRVRVQEKMPRSRETVERLADQQGDKTAELYRTIKPEVDTTASVDAFMRGDGTYVVEVINSNGKKQIIKAQDANEADRIKRQYGWRDDGAEGPMQGPWDWGLTRDPNPAKDDAGKIIKPQIKLPPEGSAARRILDRLNQGRWSGVTPKGNWSPDTPSGDMPTLEYVRTILADKNNPEAAALIREWLSQKQNSDWTKRFDDNDLRPGETRQGVIKEIRENAARSRPPSPEGEPNLASVPESRAKAVDQPSLVVTGNATQDEVAEIKRRSGVNPDSRRNPPYLRKDHDARDPALQRTRGTQFSQEMLTRVIDPLDDGVTLGRDIDGQVDLIAKEQGFAKDKDGKEAEAAFRSALKDRAGEIMGLRNRGRTIEKPFKTEAGTRMGEVNFSGGTKQAKFDGAVARAAGMPDQRIVHLPPEPPNMDEVTRQINLKFDGPLSVITKQSSRGEISPKQAKALRHRIEQQRQSKLKQANELGEKMAEDPIVEGRSVGLKEFDGHGYTRGASTQTRLNALEWLIGNSPRHAGVYLPKSYTSPAAAAEDLLSTLDHKPEGLEVQGLTQDLQLMYRGHDWAPDGKAVRGKGAGPFEPPVRKPKTAAEPTPVEGEAPMTNPLPEGGSPVGVADEALTEVEDMGKTAAGRAGAKGAEALKTAGAKGGKPPRGRKPATSVPDDPRNFSPDEDAPLPPSQRRKGGVDPNFESEAGMLDGDAVDVRSPMTNPLPQGGSPVGLADDAVNGPSYPTPDDLLGDDVGDFTDADISAQAAAMAHGHQPPPGAHLPAAPNSRQRKQIQQGISADKQARGKTSAAETWDSLGRAAEDAAIANQRPRTPRPWELAEMRRLEAEAKQFGPTKAAPWELAEGRRLQAEADRARDAGFANESWDSLGNAAERAAIDGQRPAGPAPWEWAEMRRLEAEEAKDAARRAEDPNFYDSVNEADEFDPDSPATDPSARPDAPNSAQRKWEDITGDSLDEGHGVDQRQARLGVGDVYGPTPGPMHGPVPPPAPAPPTAAQRIRLLLEKFKRGEPGTPQPELPPELPPPPPDAGTPPPDLTGGAGRTPLQQAIERQAGGNSQASSAAPDPQTDEIRRAAGDKSTPNNGPAPRVEAPPGPQQPLPTDSPGMIRRLAGGALKYGALGGVGATALHLAGQLGGRSYQPFPMAPPGGAGGQGGQGGRPGMPPGLSPEDAMILEAELERAGRPRNNGFQTSFHFGR